MRHLRSLVASVALASLARAAEPVLITHATLWTDTELLADREVLIRDGWVAGVDASGKLTRPPGTRVIEAGGDTLLPGLIDSHVHPVVGAKVPKEFSSEQVYAATGRQLLRSGVTTGRIHLLSFVDGPPLKQASLHDTHPSPRYALGGPGFIGGQPTWENPRGNVWGVKSADDAVAKLRQLKAAGIDWIALHEPRKFLPGEAEAIVAEARQLGLGLMVGGDKFADIERGLELGVDSTEYLDFSATERYPDELIAKMKARGAALFCVPPIGYNHRAMAFWRGTLALDEAHQFEFFPAEVAQFARASLREKRANPDASFRRIETAFPTLPDKFRQLRAAGLQLVIGTDCGSDANFQSDAIWWEMETWRQLGVPPHEIIRAATTLPARLLRQSDIGHLGVGARGDFVLYRGKLTDGPLAVQRVRAVAKGGILFVHDSTWSKPKS